MRRDHAAVEGDDVLRDREADAETLRTCRRGFELTKTFEDEREKSRGNSGSVVLDDPLQVGLDATDRDLHVTAVRRELHGVREEIPHDLLQAMSIAAHPRSRQGSGASLGVCGTIASRVSLCMLSSFR